MKEFRWHFEAIRRKAVEDGNRMGGLFNEGPFYAVDNAKFHPKNLGLKHNEIFPLAEKSFDLNKIVEHTHAYIKGAFADAMLHITEDADRDSVKAILRQCAREKAKHIYIQADIHSLKATCRAIIRKKGEYPEAQYR